MKIQTEVTTDSEVAEDSLYKYCLRCGRKLKTEKSRIIGMGKTCLQKRSAHINSVRLVIPKEF